jgi:hypothetical protein
VRYYLSSDVAIYQTNLRYIVEFAVADITDIEWSSLPFDCLKISNEQREVIMARAKVDVGDNAEAGAEAQISQVPGAVFDDFVEGKGQGLNVLLQYSSHSHFDLGVLTCI